jgi:hypothetical protein
MAPRVAATWGQDLRLQLLRSLWAILAFLKVFVGLTATAHDADSAQYNDQTCASSDP